MAKSKNPYQVISHQHVTEKSTMLNNLQHANSNVSVRRCESPKYVFVVNKNANKQQIAEAVEQIYSNRNIKVVRVNTINVKPKAIRGGRRGFTNSFKKAIVTLEKGDSLDNA